jgi:hypothetical protein
VKLLISTKASLDDQKTIGASARCGAAFMADMEAFFAEPKANKRDEIAARPKLVFDTEAAALFVRAAAIIRTFLRVSI